jgi:tetratricopeptide (TPR) repeat protein
VLAVVLIWQGEVRGAAPVLGLILLVLGACSSTLRWTLSDDFRRRHFGQPGVDPMRQLWRGGWGAMLVGALLLGSYYLDRWTKASEPALQFNKAYNRGATATNAGEWQKAADAFSEAIQIAPPLGAETARAYAWRGNARNKLKDYSQAIDDFTEAIRLDPSAMAYRGRGQAYFNQGEQDRAVADFSEAIRLEPNEANGPYIRGLAYFKKEDYDRALADFAEAIRLNPSYRNAYLMRGSVYAKKGDEARAKADRQKAAELDPSLQHVALKDLPDFQIDPYHYKVDPYIAAAATIQAAGEDKAGKLLLALAKDQDDGEKVIVLCRMLFTAKPKAEFRRPFIGAAFFLGETKYADWPLEPIELVAGVPFLVTRGYALGGSPEHPERYLEYCIGNCAWQTAEFQPRSAAEKQKALEKLLASPKWKAGLNDEEKHFLASQIK